MEQEITETPETTLESIFISGLDNTIGESDITDFLTQFGITGEALIEIHSIKIFDKFRVLGEVKLPTDDAIKILDSNSSSRIKDCIVKLIPRSSMKAVIINNLPQIISEKDLFLVLNKIIPKLKRVVIADDSELPGKCLGVAVATYHTYEDAALAVEKLNGIILMNTKLSASWKDPSFDIINELSYETRVLYVENISTLTTVEQIKTTFEQHGDILRIKKYANKAYVEFRTIEAAKKAFENLNEKRIDGLVLQISPARKYDAEKERDLPDRNICFSKNFLDQADQQVLLKFAFDGTVPEVGDEVLTKCREIIENVKTAQKQQVDNLTNQLESFKMMQGVSTKGGDNNPMNMMFMMMMKSMNQGGAGAGGAGAMNPMMSMMNPAANQNMNPNMGNGQNNTKVEVKSEGANPPANNQAPVNPQQGGGQPAGNVNPMMGMNNPMMGMNPMAGMMNMGNMGGGGGGGAAGGMNPMMSMMNMMNMMRNMGGGGN